MSIWVPDPDPSKKKSQSRQKNSTPKAKERTKLSTFLSSPYRKPSKKWEWPIFTVIPEGFFPNYAVEPKNLYLDLVGSLDPESGKANRGKN